MRKNFEDYEYSFSLNKDWIFPYSEIPKGAYILLYGAGDVGQAYYAQINRTGYCRIVQWTDMNADRYRSWGLPVEDCANLVTDADYAVIAIASSEAAREINKYLIENGIPQDRVIWIGEKRLLLSRSVAQTRLGDPVRVRLRESLRRRGIDPSGEAATRHIEEIARRAESGDELIIPRMVIEITPVCTLRCKKCNNLMPMYENPRAVPVEEVIADIDILLQSADRIITLELIGGEPFTYRQLPELLDYVLSQDKVTEVELTTNGTIVPSEEVLQRLKNGRVTVRVSPYPCVDSGKVVNRFLEYGIRYETWEEIYWIDSGDTEKRNRDEESNKAVYSGCDAGIYCKTLYRGRIYACARSASLYDLGICNEAYGFLNIRNNADLKGSLRDFYLKQEDPSCDYCDFTEMWRLIKAGEQIERE